MLSPKADTSRLNWLEHMKSELASPSSDIRGSLFEEILEFCLNSTKKADIAILSARVATLATLWGAYHNDGLLEEKLIAMLHQWKGRGDYFTTILACLICVVATSETVPHKVVETLLKNYVAPVIHEESDLVAARLCGEEVEEVNQSDEDEPVLADYLVEFMEAWQACITLLDEESAKVHMKAAMSSFVQLLEHEVDAIRLGAAHCLLSIADLSDRYEVNIDEELSEVEKTISRVAHDHDIDWSGDGTSRKTFEAIGELLKAKETVVTVDLVTVTGAPARGSRETDADFRHYAANFNRKGHPVAGYADASLIQYFHSHLGHHFADLFTIKDIHRYRNNERTYNAMLRILIRHPASRSGATHIEALRSHGASSFNPVRSNNYGRSYDNPRRHRKVRVSDFL